MNSAAHNSVIRTSVLVEGKDTARVSLGVIAAVRLQLEANR
ncbi:hypothetical protein [Anabaena catenula]|nr:hypothetical protein [Anabaena catenula]